MKNYLYVALGCIITLTSCQAQSVATTTNPDGSVTIFKGNSTATSVTISAQGNMGIGQSNPKDKLEVNGQIHAKSVKVDLKEWADFVFDKDYDLTRLREIENYINTYGHLPQVPSEKEVLEEGIELGAMNKILLQKIEELTLHLIQKEKDIEQLKSQFEQLQKEVKALEN